MNQSLTLAFLVAAGIGLVVQNTLMVRITQSSSTILIAMLLNSLVGIVLFVSILLLKQGVAGFSELAATVRWWTLIPRAAGFVFRVCQHQRVSERWRGDDYRRAGGKPADWRAGNGRAEEPRRSAARPDWPGMRRGDAGRRAWLVARRQF
ncbi:inner membrane protein YdcZ [Enterobacter asburiae]|uniref:Inner membrane protein YdcZ n=1 Tax=Enterobacter asburiae TaxID=61645 RepID=A0A376F8H4_ENTAS|nr:inner membrane protein YdcZ [Enterobacter asburiae]